MQKQRNLFVFRVQGKHSWTTGSAVYFLQGWALSIPRLCFSRALSFMVSAGDSGHQKCPSHCVPLVRVSSMTWPNCKCAVVGMPMAGLDSAPVKSRRRGFGGSLLISTRGLWAECSQWAVTRGGRAERASGGNGGITTADIFQPVFPVETSDDGLNSTLDGVRCAKHFLRDSWCVSLTPFSPAQGRAWEFKVLWLCYKAASMASCLGFSSSLITHLPTTPNPLSTAREIF